MILSAARRALEEDGAEAIWLGGAGMTASYKKLEVELHVPVVDGVVAALKLMEGLLGYGVHASKRLACLQPGHKELVGYADVFRKPYKKK